LIINVNWLGDCLFSTPFIRAVRNNFPAAYIACMVVPGCREVLEGNPNINEIIPYDEKHAGLAGSIKMAGLLRRRRFDTVFLLHRSFTRTLLAYLAGIHERIGYHTSKRAFLLTKKPKPPKDVLHRARFYLALLEAIGLKTDDKGCDFFIGPGDEKWAQDFLNGNGVRPHDKIIVFNPGGNWLPKRWPLGNFGMLAESIRRLFGDKARILISGSKKDLQLAERISGYAGQDVIVACGKASLKQTAALFKKADVVISGDSGPLHIAVSVGAKTIGLFGPTSPEITGPYRADPAKVIVMRKDIIRCQIPCYTRDCRDYGCMYAITPEEVFKAVERFLK
jgi:lipopolysaccharide heptosyltransferase II